MDLCRQGTAGRGHSRVMQLGVITAKESADRFGAPELLQCILTVISTRRRGVAALPPR